MTATLDHPYRIIGTRPIRPDGIEKVTGKALQGGHSLQEGNPKETQEEILNFLKA